MRNRALVVVTAITSVVIGARSDAATPSNGNDRQLPTVYTPTKMNLYTSYCGLWRTDASYESTIRLSNQLAISGIDANVTLFMADGTAYALPLVHLDKSGVSTVDINAALAAAPDSVRPHLSSYGSASVSYKYDWQGVVYAFMSILDIPRSLQYSYPFMFPMNGSMQMDAKSKAMPAMTTEEGLIWRYSRQSDAFLSFANTSNRPINTDITVLNGDGEVSQVRHFSVPAMNTVLINLGLGKEEPGLGAEDELVRRTPAGVRVSFDADSDSLQIVGGIEDAKYGYSANLPIGPGPDPAKAGDATTNSFASAGVMVGAQDPMMGFPEKLRFEPYAYFRNAGTRALQLSGKVFYVRGGKTQSMDLPVLELRPNQARKLDVADAIRSLGLNGAVTLAFSYQGQSGALLVSTGSVDQSGNYVFAVMPRATGQSASKSSIFWTTANGFDTRYSVWNSQDEPQDVLFTFQ